MIDKIEAHVGKATVKTSAMWLIGFVLVFCCAFLLVFQVFQYRHDYRELSKYLREKEELNAEWGRLLIERQTFGATAQIGTRAVTQLRMYSPPPSQTVVISTAAVAKEQ